MLDLTTVAIIAQRPIALLLHVSLSFLCFWLYRSRWPVAALARSVCRVLCCRGRRLRGEFSNLRFPIRPADILGPDGPHVLTQLLRHGEWLAPDVVVTSVVDRGRRPADGVKGDKVIVDVTYSSSAGAALPSSFFVKFNVARLSAMRLLVETTRCCECEAMAYALIHNNREKTLADSGHVPSSIAEKAAAALPAPKCYFVDFNRTSGEFVLVSDVVEFGTGRVQPLKHRIRDTATPQNIITMITAGARLNAALWYPPTTNASSSTATAASSLVRSLPRYDDTHREMWVLAAVLARLGLSASNRRLLGSREVNRAWMTWRPPPELIGREADLIADMPSIMASLCQDNKLLAYGHCDLTLDNSIFIANTDSASKSSSSSSSSSSSYQAVDWQQACVGNVGIELFWNLHFLPPDFLAEHEEAFFDAVLATWRHAREAPTASRRQVVTREELVEAYCLGCVQMYCWGGGGIQMLLKALDRAGVYRDMVPDDPRCRGEAAAALDPLLREKVVGAEMTRRTLTNCCEVMRRHGFVARWERWRRRQLQ